MHTLQESGIFGIMVIAVFGMLFLPGIIAIVITRSRKATIILMLLSFLPLLLGLTGTGLGYHKVDQSINIQGQSMSIELRQEAESQGRDEARSTTYIGSIATLVLIMVFGCGYALRRDAEQAAPHNS